MSVSQQPSRVAVSICTLPYVTVQRNATKVFEERDSKNVQVMVGSGRQLRIREWHEVRIIAERPERHVRMETLRANVRARVYIIAGKCFSAPRVAGGARQ